MSTLRCHRITPLKIILLCVAITAVTSILVANPFQWGVVSLGLTAPATCSQDDEVTIRVDVVGRGPIQVDVTLYERDAGRDDEIGTRTVIRRLNRDSIKDEEPWVESVEFTFAPRAFERGKQIELYAQAGKKRSPLVKLRCR